MADHTFTLSDVQEQAFKDDSTVFDDEVARLIHEKILKRIDAQFVVLKSNVQSGNNTADDVLANLTTAITTTAKVPQP